jgi:hypothetical protein
LPTTPPESLRRRPVGLAAEISLLGHPRVVPSGRSSSLLLAGLALTLLVIGETTFLRLAASRVAIAPPGKSEQPRPPTRASYSIRRVF